MNELTIVNLERCFNTAGLLGKKFVGVKISMEGFPADEIIINPTDNFKKKLEYYKGAYNDNLILKATDKIRITGFTYGDCFEDIQEDLVIDYEQTN